MLVYLQMLDTAGKRGFFAALYECNYRLMLKKATTILGNSGWAEDAVHDAFLRIIKYLDKFRDKSAVDQQYLCIAIARNAALDVIKKNNRYVSIPIDKIEPGEELIADGDDQFLVADIMLTLDAEVKKLDEPLRDVVTFRFFEQFTTRETAELLGISEDAVKVRLHRARKQLLEALRNG